MNFKKVLLLTLPILVLIMGFVVYEHYTAPTPVNLATAKPMTEVAKCSAINLKEQAPGTVCITSQGWKFKRLHINGAFAIQDLGPNGKIWFDEITLDVTQPEALKNCQDRGLELPSGYPTSDNGKYGFPDRDSDFELAESRGFREAFNGDMKNNYFWSSSVLPNGIAYDFDGYNGSLVHGLRDFKLFNIASRCVASPKEN